MLPGTLSAGLTAQGVPQNVADQVAGLRPVASLFAAFLGYNPVQALLGPTGVRDSLPTSSVDTLTGKEFFPQLMAGPFHHGLVVVFSAAAAMTLVGAVASLMRGSRYVHVDEAPEPSVRRQVEEDAVA